jgi:hypothetical protein
VANYSAIQGVMSAIVGMPQEVLPPELSGSTVNASVQLSGSAAPIVLER